MSATITTVYHNKAGEIVSNWEAAESVTYHTICTNEQADAAEAKFRKAQDEYIRHISKLAPQNERLSLEFSKLAGLALYHELPVDEKTLNLALKYVNR